MRLYLFSYSQREDGSLVVNEIKPSTNQNKDSRKYLKIILENYKVTGSVLDLVDGAYNFSKSIFFGAIKVYSLAMVIGIAFYANCKIFTNDTLFPQRTDTIYNSLCPDPENLLITVINFKLSSLLLGMSIGAIQFFHGKN